jgi:putative addiction module component (TIGR02574 family)
MTNTASKFLEEALSLQPTERAEVAERLLVSLDPLEDDSEVEASWQFEIDKRISEINSGKVICIPWEEVRAKATGASDAAR